MDKVDQIQDLAKAIRLTSLEMARACGKNGSHLGGGLSPVDIFACLFGGVLNLSPSNSVSEDRDRLVISKGHCVLSYYSALYLKGFLTKADIESFEVSGSHFHGHAMRNLHKGIEFSGGSLSMGMSFAVGEAYACKLKGLRNRVFCLVGDGECDEGLIWEAAMAASHFNLGNFTLIVDRNHLQYDGLTASVMNTNSLPRKFEAFGFHVVEVDGHSAQELLDAFTIESPKPKCIIANTVKGKGVSFMEGVKEWHHHTLTEEEYQTALNEITNV